MRLKFFIAEDFDSNVKASIHATGKLGFTDAAIRRLGVESGKGIMLAKDEDDNTGDYLYLKVVDNNQTGVFKFSKAGTYYYVNARMFFDQMGYDYKNKTIKFDIVPVIYEGDTIYKLIKTEKERKSDSDEE